MFGLGDLTTVTIGVFAGILIMFVMLALAGSGTEARTRLDKRLSRVGTRGAMPSSQALMSELRRETNSNQGVDRLLNRLLPNRRALEARLDKAGMKMPLWAYVLVCVVVGVAVTIGARFGIGLAAPFSIMIGAALGFILPHMYVGRRARKRLQKFLMLFPDALDLMVRTVKSGLPIAEAIDLAGNDMEEPIRTEFRRVSDKMRVGKQLEEALLEAAERLDLPEFHFFVVSLSVQRETGGNIAETLANLSTLLRRRQQMKLKIKALSAEARASAWIVGALPFAMTAVLFIVNQPYIMQLFTDPRGHVLIGGGLLLQFMGVAWMMKLSRFEI